MRSEHPRSRRWILAGAMLLPALYLPTLGAPFDFNDDGGHVYPASPQPLASRLRLVWQKIVANVEHLGPFRPTLWLHWEAQAELFDGKRFSWRLARLVWSGLAAGMLLWLLAELGIHPGAALFAAALAMWNPYRGEIWRSLTLSEGVAMPYALFALICAIRAARAPRPLPWDLAGIGSILVALGCKNTFAAVVPAQMILRIAPDGFGWRDGWRRHGRQALGIASTLLLPIAYFLYFRSHWHPGQYEVAAPTAAQAGRILKALRGAGSLDFLAPAVAFGAAAFVAGRPTSRSPGSTETTWRANRGALVSGLALLLAGIAVYLPMGGMAGRYTIPAVWGLDLILAASFSALLLAPPTIWKRAASVALAAGLLAVAVASVGRQSSDAARARVLWQALQFVEREAPAGAGVAWTVGPLPSESAPPQSTPGGHMGEAIHFGWHLRARGRSDLRYGVIDEQGRWRDRPELPGPRPERLSFVLAAGPIAPWPLRSEGARWRRVHFRVPYRGGRWRECYVWMRRPAGG